MPPVETTARKSDLLSVKQHFKSSNENLRCNFDEIADLKLQAVYVKGENANNVFMVFDQSTEAKVADAELVIEIIPLGGLMFDPVKNKDFIRTINGYTAYVNEAAPCFWEDYQTRFGKTSIVIDVAVDGYNYWIRAAPTFTLEEALEIANAITS